MYVTLTDRVGRQVIAQPSYPSIHFKSSSREELMEIKDKLLDVKDFDELDDKDEEYCELMILYNFSSCAFFLVNRNVFKYKCIFLLVLKLMLSCLLKYFILMKNS